ncbi:transposase [Streptomyces sp. M10(2022)]
MEDASMTSENVTEAETVEVSEAVSAKSVDDRLIDELVGRAQAEGLQLTGEGGLLQQLTKRLLESALEGEITDHLGYDKHDPVGKNGGNSRNGTRAKTVLTDVGPVEISVPATARAPSNRRSSRSGRSACPAWTRWSFHSRRRA